MFSAQQLCSLRFNQTVLNHDYLKLIDLPMKKLTGMLSLAALAVGTLQAQDLSVTTTFAWESSYVFRGDQLAEETFMPALDLSYGGAYAGIWAALPAGDDDPNEVDFYGGYGFAVSELVSGDVGFSYYTYPDSEDDFGDGATFEIYGGVSFDVPLEPSLYLYYDFDLESFTAEGSLGHTYAVSEVSDVALSGYVGQVEPDEGDGYTYYGVTVSFDYTLNDAVSASAYVNWAGASEDLMSDGDSNEVWFGFSVSAGM